MSLLAFASKDLHLPQALSIAVCVSCPTEALLIVGCTQEALLMPGGSLSLIGDCLDMLGQPLIPVLLLVLGANLAAGPGPGNIPTHSALVVVATRLVLLPLLGCAAVLTAQRTGLISMQDPLTLVVMMVAWSTPTGAYSAAVHVTHTGCKFQSIELG